MWRRRGPGADTPPGHCQSSVLQSYTTLMARPGAGAGAGQGAGLDNRGFEGDGANVASSPPAAAPPPEAAGADLPDCSLLGLRLRPLNLLRGPKCCLVFLSLAAFVQGLCINGLANVVITTIERRSALARARQELC